MHGEEVFVPVILFLSIAGIFGVRILTRHKERMTMIEKGLKAEDMKSLYERATSPTNPLSSLKWGVVFVAIGVAVLLGMYLRQTYYVDESIFVALIALFGGLGLISFYVVARKKAQQ